MLLRPSSLMGQVAAPQQPCNVAVKPGLVSPDAVEQQAPQSLTGSPETLTQVNIDLPIPARDPQPSLSKVRPSATEQSGNSASAAVSHDQQLLQAQSGVDQVNSSAANLLRQQLLSVDAAAALEHTAGTRHPRVPDGLVMMAVPGQHSRKPQLAQLLRPYLPADATCLEVCFLLEPACPSEHLISCSTGGLQDVCKNLVVRACGITCTLTLCYCCNVRLVQEASLQGLLDDHPLFLFNKNPVW